MSSRSICALACMLEQPRAVCRVDGGGFTEADVCFGNGIDGGGKCIVLAAYLGSALDGNESFVMPAICLAGTLFGDGSFSHHAMWLIRSLVGSGCRLEWSMRRSGCREPRTDAGINVQLRCHSASEWRQWRLVQGYAHRALQRGAL